MPLFIWSYRIIVYSAAVYVSFTYLFPIGDAGPYIAAPLAALAIAGDLFLTAKFRGTDVAAEVAKRLALADKVLGDRSDRTLEAPEKRPEITGYDETERERLAPGESQDQ